jgi:hypothetical protein
MTDIIYVLDTLTQDIGKILVTHLWHALQLFQNIFIDAESICCNIQMYGIQIISK